MRVWKSITITIAASGTLVLSGLAPPAYAHQDDHHGGDSTVMMQDRCDPTTFNAPAPTGIGPGTCTATSRRHRVTLQKFLANLAAHPDRVLRSGDNKGWEFDPGTLTIRTGTDLVATNVGGEAHTFTLVPAFGGGCVPPLNAPFNLPMSALCGTAAFGSSLAIPGTSITVKGLKAGTYKYECLIHPWMRTTVTVSDTATATIDEDND
jgi:plastocyanin